MRRKALDIALAWPHHDQQTLGDLVQHLHGIPQEDQEKVWELVVAWASSGIDDESKAYLRERIRLYAFTRHGWKRELSDQSRSRAQDAYDLLVADDPVVLNKWLFAEHWVEESFDELEQGNFDHRKREERIGKLRMKALQDIWGKLGCEGILRLCHSGNAELIIGWHLAGGIINAEHAPDFLDRLVSEQSAQLRAKVDNCMHGYLSRLDNGDRDKSCPT